MTKIEEEIAKKVQGTSIENLVIDKLVSDEVKRRSEIIVNALNILNEKEKEFKKLQPNKVVYDDEGVVLQKGWSKDIYDKLSKLKTQIRLIGENITQCLSKNEPNDYENLEKKIK